MSIVLWFAAILVCIFVYTLGFYFTATYIDERYAQKYGKNWDTTGWRICKLLIGAVLWPTMPLLILVLMLSKYTSLTIATVGRKLSNIKVIYLYTERLAIRVANPKIKDSEVEVLDAR